MEPKTCCWSLTFPGEDKRADSNVILRHAEMFFAIFVIPQNSHGINVLEYMFH